VGKYNIDDILNQLGVDNPKAKKEGGENTPPPARVDGEKHTIDQQAGAFSNLPSRPANQRVFNTDAEGGLVAQGTNQPSAAPSRDTGRSSNDVGIVLLERGKINQERLTLAENVIKTSPGRRMADVLMEQGVDEVAVQEALALVHNIPFERIDLTKGLEGGFDGKLLQRLTPEFCKKNNLIPLRTEGNRTVVGMTRADDLSVVDAVRQRLGATPKLVLITALDVKSALELVGVGQEEQVDVSKMLEDVDDADVTVEKKIEGEVDLEKEAGEGPVVRYVNYIIQTAVKEGASDIHIEPGDKKLRVRFRIDGELFEMMNPPASMSGAITSRLKIMANLDIAERRLPQDGRIRCQVQGRKLDLRMSTLPNGYGEKVVMRILDTRSINVELEQLGFDENTFQIWRKAIDSPHGIVLVTGPTGSGKTTTLYASLRKLDKASMNISTCEDPVEYHLDGITQTQMHEKIGMTFGMALKALLRQDPDVVMLGEIRDVETAGIAIQASLTGHLVLSTLHTNDAPSSITRLVNIGVEPFLVGAAVNAVLAQRLIRRLCVACKTQEKPSDDMAEFLAMHAFDTEKMWVAKGCEKCRNSGYSGRVGIYELLMVDDGLRDIIARNPNVAEFRRLCAERGMVTLRQDGLKKVALGVTTVSEVLRVTEGNH
jgi:type IV pilus assembly protein PilB